MKEKGRDTEKENERGLAYGQAGEMVNVEEEAWKDREYVREIMRS